MEQENFFKHSRFNLGLLITFILISGIVTGLNISRSIETNQANINPLLVNPPQSPTTVLSASNEATSSASPNPTQKLPRVSPPGYKY